MQASDRRKKKAQADDAKKKAAQGSAASAQGHKSATDKVLLGSVYYYNEAQKKEAEEVFGEVQAKLGSGAPFFTELCPAEVFYPAEEYHQQYLWDKGGRGGNPQSAEKGCTDTIRCYG